MTSCSFHLCGKPVQAFRLCNGHYNQRHRGEELRPLRVVAAGDPSSRLDAHTEKTPECWNWTGSTRKGYGQIRVNGRIMAAHRLAYEIANGALDADEKLDHRCRNRLCVRPEHLHVVTNKANMENLDPAGYAGNGSGARGVSWDPQTSRWRAKLTHHGRTIHVGRFDTVAEAQDAITRRRATIFTNSIADRV